MRALPSLAASGIQNPLALQDIPTLTGHRLAHLGVAVCEEAQLQDLRRMSGALRVEEVPCLQLAVTAEAPVMVPSLLHSACL
jgi:hypothetical protein